MWHTLKTFLNIILNKLRFSYSIANAVLWDPLLNAQPLNTQPLNTQPLNTQTTLDPNHWTPKLLNTQTTEHPNYWTPKPLNTQPLNTQTTKHPKTRFDRSLIFTYLLSFLYFGSPTKRTTALNTLQHTVIFSIIIICIYGFVA